MPRGPKKDRNGRDTHFTLQGTERQHLVTEQVHVGTQEDETRRGEGILLLPTSCEHRVSFFLKSNNNFELFLSVPRWWPRPWIYAVEQFTLFGEIILILSLLYIISAAKLINRAFKVST